MKSSVALIRSAETCFAKIQRNATTLTFLLLVFIVLPISFSSQAFASGGSVEWVFNAAMVGKQEPRVMAVDSSGNVIMAGYAEATSSDYHLIKILADGSGLAWPAKTFDRAGGPDLATAVVVDGNDDIIVTGYVHNGSNYDIHTIKYSGVDGSILWQHTFDGTGKGNDFAAAIAVDALNNIYVGGSMQDTSAKDDFVIIKYVPGGPNPDGTPTWTAAYNGPDDAHDRLTAIAVGINGLAVTGESQNAATDFDFVVVKFALDGSYDWQKRYSDAGNGKGLDVAIEASGNVIATGYIDDGTDRDHYTVKYPSTDGAALWSKTRDRGYDDEGRALWLDSAGNVYVAGYSFTLATNKDLAVSRYAAADGSDTAPDGWHVDYNTVNGNSDLGIDITGNDSGDVFVASISNDNAGGFDDIHTYKFCKEHGTLLWPASYGDLSKHDRPIGLALAPDGHPIMAGWSDSTLNSYDFVAVKYNAGALNAPTSLTAESVSNSEITLAWSDNSDNEDNFVVERRNGSDEWQEIASALLPGTISYSDAGLTPDHRYYYRVKAVNAADGSSPWSNDANARTTIISYEQPTWQHVYTGPAGGDDEPAAIAVGPDNHPVVTGFSFAAEGGYDYYTIKLDRSDAAVEQWSARYNDDDNESDFAKAVAVDSSNRVVVSGYASLYYPGGASNTNDVYTIGYPQDGSNPAWAHQYNGPSGDDDRSAAVATAVDGSDHVVVVGYGKNAARNDDIYVIKYSADGMPQTPLWAAIPYDGGGDDQPAAVAYDPQGDVFVAGKSWNGSNFDYSVAKYNGSDGSLAWGGAPRFYNGTGNSTDYANSLAVDATGNLYVTGYSVGSGGSGDIVTLKYDGETGNLLPGWPQVYDGGGYDTGVSIVIDIVNNDVVVAGTTFKGPGNHDVIVVRYTSSGDEVWSKFLDFNGSDEGVAAMATDRTGVVCVAAATDNGSGDDIVTVMFDHTGLTVGANVLAGSAGGLDYPVDVAFNAFGEAFVAGVTSNLNNNTDFIVFKTTSTVEQSPAPLTATQLYTEANLVWADNSLNETGFRVEFKTGRCSDTAEWNYVTETAANATSYLAGGLNPDSTYCFRVQSQNALGEKSRWSEVDVVTAASVAPGELTAAALDTTRILLEWNDLTTGESKFNLQRCPGSSCDFSDAATLASFSLTAETTSYVDDEVCEGQTYRYRINAEKVGRWVSGYTETPGVTAESRQAPTDLLSDWVSEAWVELKWLDNNPDETAFVIERCVGNACTNFTDPVTISSPSGNLLHLRMDEASWGTVNDLSEAGNHGTAAGAAATTALGKYAGAGIFNGTSAYISTPLVIDQSAETSQGATFAAWVYPTSVSADHHFVIGTDNGGNDWSLLRNAGTWYVANGVDAALVNTGVAVTVNSWQHLALVFDPASGVILYRNGLVAWSHAAIAFDDSSAALHLGRRGSLNQDFFDGRLDEVTVFNRPLTLSEVGTLHDHGLGRYNDRTVVPSTIYNYQVRASKDASCDWTSDSSSPHQVTTTPPAPTSLLASAANANRVNLAWTDNTTTESKFILERCATAGCSDFTELPGLIEQDAVSFNDESPCPDTLYRYRIKAVNESNWTSAYSNEVTVSTPTLQAPVVTSNVSEEQVELQWPANSGDLSGYKVSRCQGDAAFCSDPGNYILMETEPVLPAGAMMMLPMDEAVWRGSPGEVSDITGNDKHGQAFGGVTTVAGKLMRGGSFDGTDDYVKTSLKIDQSTTTVGVTFEAWVYPTLNANGQYLFSTDDGGTDWGVYQAGVNWGVVAGNGSYIPAPNVTVSLNSWQHLMVTFKPGVGVTIYKNGNQMIGTTSAINYDNNATEVTIGRQGIYNQGYFKGIIDNVVVYNRVLSPGEILARYQSYGYSDSGLPSDTEFQYRVWPYKTAGCSTDGPYVSVMVKTLKPPAPTNLLLTSVNTTQINASWTDLATSETDYRIQWCEGTGCIFPSDVTVNSATLGSDAQSYTDLSVCEDRDYRYQVRAEKDWLSEADYGWVTDWTTGDVSTLAKAASDNFSATVVSESEIALAWSDNNLDEDTYLLDRCINHDAASCPVDVDAVFTPVVTTVVSTLRLKMDESSWGTVVNSAPGGTNATRYGDAAPVNDAERGQVGYFDGSGDYLQVNNYAGINPDKSITVSVWAKSAGATWSEGNTLMSKRNAYVLGSIGGNTGVQFWVFINNDWRQLIVSGLAIDITQWHHYTGTYDGANLILYVDGGEVGRLAYAGTIAADTGPIMIGKDDYGTPRYLNGWLDDALIFDQALSSTEVLALYTGEMVPTPDTVDSGLTPGTEYFYRLRASKQATCNWPTEWTLRSATTITPPAPTGLTLTIIDTTTIDIDWVDNSGAETGYILERCEGVGCSSFAAVPTADGTYPLADNTQYFRDAQVKEGQTFSYRVRAEKTSDPAWVTTWLGPQSATARAKTAPVNLTATRISEAGIELAWDDSNTDESGFKIERCAGVGCVDFVEIDDVAGNGANTTNLVASGTLATGSFTPYAYNVTHPTTGLTVRALRLYNNGSPQASNSTALALNIDTDYVVTFEAWCDAGADINLQNDLLPDTLPEFQHLVSPTPKTFRVVFNSSHPDMLGSTMMRFFHYNPSRYIYVTNIKMTPPSRVLYTDIDSGLLPDTTYRYQVKSYKTATNSWLAGPSNVAQVKTDVVAPGPLVATAINTTEVALKWTDNSDTETGTEIWRSAAGCGSFVKISEVGPMVAAYTDDEVVTDTDYCYKVSARNDGLSRNGGGEWTHYAPVVISPYSADSYYQITVPWNGNMQSNFADLRFYDESAQRQLSYWIKDFVPGVSATVWLRTRSNNTINMYYGNPNVSDVGNDADFNESFEFPGVVIDSDDWVEVDAYDAIEQNDGLVLHTTSNYSWNKALISRKAYDRQFQWQLSANLTINGDTNAGSGDWFLFGWLLNQSTFTSYNQFVHGLYWSNYWLNTYEKGANSGTGKPYTADTDYEVKVALTPAGAEYSIRGGAFADWTLLATRNGYTDQFMRIAVGQRSHNATIHNISIVPTPLSATLGSEIVNVRTSFGYPWVSADSNIATVKTPAPVAPGNLVATAVSDSEINLSWNDNTDAESRFYIERCQNAGCSNFTPLGDVPGNVTSYQDTALPVSTAYNYRVRAYKGAIHPWFSLYSNSASATTFPQSATGLIAIPLSSRMIELTWQDQATDEEGYEIEVMVWNGRFVKTGRVGADETTYIDKVGIEPGKTYVYRVRPYRGDDMSPYSNPAEATPQLSDGDGTCVDP